MIIVEELPRVPAPAGSERDLLVLPWEDRQKTRQRVRSQAGREITIKLPTGTRLPPGTVVAVGTGFHVEVAAADEDVWLVCSSDARTVARAAYEIGNRHFPIEIGEGTIAVRYDHTLGELWDRLGVPAARSRRPFLPEQPASHHHD